MGLEIAKETSFVTSGVVLAEIIYPTNRIVVDYGNFKGLIVLRGKWFASHIATSPEKPRG
jgi:hypothetical protein